MNELKNTKVNVLGIEYTFEIQTKEENKFLNDCDGYCDKSTKKIVVTAEPKGNELENFFEYQKICARHEIIHAFLFESGLANNFEHNQWGHDETFVDWFAIQFTKMQKAFEEVGCI